MREKAHDVDEARLGSALAAAPHARARQDEQERSNVLPCEPRCLPSSSSEK